MILRKYYVNDIVNFPNYVNDSRPMLLRDGLEIIYISIIYYDFGDTLDRERPR